MIDTSGIKYDATGLEYLIPVGLYNTHGIKTLVGIMEKQSLTARGVMARAWAIFRATYRYPTVPFRSIGRQCFAWAMRKAWAEAKFTAALAATSSEALQAQVDRIDRELSELKYRCLSLNASKREAELRALARPLIAELLRRSVASSQFKLAA